MPRSHAIVTFASPDDRNAFNVVKIKVFVDAPSYPVCVLDPDLIASWDTRKTRSIALVLQNYF